MKRIEVMIHESEEIAVDSFGISILANRSNWIIDCYFQTVP